MDKPDDTAWPSKLFKYRQVDEKAIEIIRSGSLYFASPSSLNDPFDCNASVLLGTRASMTIIKRILEEVKSGLARRALRDSIAQKSHHAKWWDSGGRWQYESEYRYVSHLGAGCRSYKPYAIVRIIAGCRFNSDLPENKEFLQAIRQRNEKRPKGSKLSFARCVQLPGRLDLSVQHVRSLD